jgi:ATP-binding cassette subfamily B multidrug efflux pump
VYTNDIDTTRQMISQSIVQIVNSTITIVSILAMMLVLNIPLTLITLAMTFVMMICTSFATRASGKGFIKQQKALGALNGFIEETMSGEKVVKVFTHEDECVEKFDELNESLYESAYRANAYSNILGPINAQLGNASYVICAMVGGLLALNQYAGFTVGALASFLTFNKNFSMPINQVSTQFNFILQALAGAERIFDLMDAEPEKDEGYVTLVNSKLVDGKITETPEHTGHWAWRHEHQATGVVDYVPLKGDVTFNDVDFGYTDEKIVLHNVRFTQSPVKKSLSSDRPEPARRRSPT